MWHDSVLLISTMYQEGFDMALENVASNAVLQVHIRRGRPHERLLRQTAEVVFTAAVISFCTIAYGHFHLKVSGRQNKHYL